MSKTRRKAYTGSKAVDKSCRGKRGSCPTCSENRQHKNTKREIKEDYEINVITKIVSSIGYSLKKKKSGKNKIYTISQK